MCAVLRLLAVRSTIVELKEAEKELASEIAEAMGAGVTEIVVQDVADQSSALIVWRRSDDLCKPVDIKIKKLPMVRSRG